MFLNYIKDFFAKKLLKSRLHNVKSSNLTNSIQTVGLLIDESNFSKEKDLIKELVANGISEENLKIIIFSEKFKKNKVYEFLTFGPGLINWNLEITNPAVNDFINEKFDLLISYYDVEKAILLQITSNSKAQFKVGFSSIDKRLNHLMIDTTVEKYKIFTFELSRYLKLLNKI